MLILLKMDLVPIAELIWWVYHLMGLPLLVFYHVIYFHFSQLFASGVID